MIPQTWFFGVQGLQQGERGNGTWGSYTSVPTSYERSFLLIACILQFFTLQAFFDGLFFTIQQDSFCSLRGGVLEGREGSRGESESAGGTSRCR